MNIDEMPAGREIDALILELIFEKKACHCKSDPSMCAFGPNHCLTCDGWMPRFHSTNIAAAWEVVEKLGQKELNFFIESCKPHYNWWAQFVPHNKDDEVHGEADTAPLAICRAALKAVMK